MTTDKQSLRGILREKFPRSHDQLLPALHFLQHEFSYLPDWAMEVVGWHLGIPASEVYGAATSYSELRLQKPARHVLKVCTGLSCWVNGGRELLGLLESGLRGRGDEAAQEGLVTLEETACGFLCGVAPAMQLNGVWRGRMTPGRVRAILQGLTRE